MPRLREFLRSIDVGEYSPFELASLFKIWQAMTPEKRRAVEQRPAIVGRHEAMFKAAEAKNIPREIKPDDFDEESATRFEAVAKGLKASARRHLPNRLLNELQEEGRSLTSGSCVRSLRRQAINHYFVEIRRKPSRPSGLPSSLRRFHHGSSRRSTSIRPKRPSAG